MYLSLDDVKRHLIIDHDDDDKYLADLITVAEDAVKTDLNLNSLCEIEDNDNLSEENLNSLVTLSAVKDYIDKRIGDIQDVINGFHSGSSTTE